MTREDAKKAAEVMLAYANGEEIESLFYGEYVSCEEPTFNWISGKGIENYRIKPKEKFNPKTLKPFDKVLVRRGSENYDVWFPDFVSSPPDDNNNKTLCMCIMDDIAMVIPYNDETKHLLGTSDEAPEYYRYWED